MLVTVTEQCEQKIMGLRDQEKQGTMSPTILLLFTVLIL